MSNLSRGLPEPLASADPLPATAYWPDWIEVRKPAEDSRWPVLEVPNSIVPDSLRRFGFDFPAERLIAGFDAWASTMAHEPTAMCAFLNHQKHEIFDADHRQRPWQRADVNVLETMQRFFEHVREPCTVAGRPVRISRASDAVEDFVRHSPPPRKIATKRHRMQEE